MSVAQLDRVAEHRTMIDDTATLGQQAMLFILQLGVELAANQTVDTAVDYYRSEMPASVEPFQELVIANTADYYLDMRRMAALESGIKYGELALANKAVDLSATRAKTSMMVNLGINKFLPKLEEVADYAKYSRRKLGLVEGFAAGALTLIEVNKHVDLVGMGREFAGVVQKSLFSSSAEAVSQFGEEDSDFKGEERVPRSESCAWCIFMSVSTEVQPPFHDWCHCQSAPTFKGASSDFSQDFVDSFTNDYDDAYSRIASGEPVEGRSLRLGTAEYAETIYQELKGPAREDRKYREEAYDWDAEERANQRELTEANIRKLADIINKGIYPNKAERQLLQDYGFKPWEFIHTRQKDYLTTSAKDVLSLLRKEYGYR